jgi:hypothetical protein
MPAVAAAPVLPGQQPVLQKLDQVESLLQKLLAAEAATMAANGSDDPGQPGQVVRFV